MILGRDSTASGYWLIGNVSTEVGFLAGYGRLGRMRYMSSGKQPAVRLAFQVYPTGEAYFLRAAEAIAQL